MNRRSLASWPAQRNIPLARRSPCSAAPDATASTADATPVPTQTHPTWITGKAPPAADLLVPGTSESGLASHLHPSPGILLFPQPAPAIALRSPVQQSWLPSDFTASRGIHCQPVWAGSPQPAPCGFHREMEMHIRVPGTAPSSLPRACRPRDGSPTALSLEAALSLGLCPRAGGREAACTEPAGQSWSSCSDLREYTSQGMLMAKGIAVRDKQGARQQPQTQLSLQTLPKRNLSKIPINALGISLNNPASRTFLPLENPPEGCGAGELEGSNPFVHSWDAWHCSEPQLPAQPLPQCFAFYGSPSREASRGRMQENT